MAIIVSEVVDIPSHSVRIKNGRYEYIYFTQKTYRDKNGQVRNDRICIGKPSDQPGKMVSNKNYYTVFCKTEPTHLPDMIRSCGSFAVCRQLSEELSLTDHLKKAFPGIYEEILTIAHYMLVNGSVMYYLNDWLDGCVSFTADPLDGASIGRVFSEVQEKDKNEYIYFTQKTYRDKNGQVRNDRICIGKPSDQPGKMVPNKNYYTVFCKTEPTHLPDMIRSCGSFAVCRQLSEELSLKSALMTSRTNWIWTDFAAAKKRQLPGRCSPPSYL